MYFSNLKSIHIGNPDTQNQITCADIALWLHAKFCLHVRVTRTYGCIRRYAKVWARMWRYCDIPRYRRLPWLSRKQLDCKVIGLAARTPEFWFAVLVLLAGVLLANVLCWHFDIDGGRRDLLRATPFMLVAPGAAMLRRKLIVRVLSTTRNGS
jgi:hypothetical protein